MARVAVFAFIIGLGVLFVGHPAPHCLKWWKVPTVPVLLLPRRRPGDNDGDEPDPDLEAEVQRLVQLAMEQLTQSLDATLRRVRRRAHGETHHGPMVYVDGDVFRRDLDAAIRSLLMDEWHEKLTLPMVAERMRPDGPRGPSISVATLRQRLRDHHVCEEGESAARCLARLAKPYRRRPLL